MVPRHPSHICSAHFLLCSALSLCPLSTSICLCWSLKIRFLPSWFFRLSRKPSACARDLRGTLLPLLSHTVGGEMGTRRRPASSAESWTRSEALQGGSSVYEFVSKIATELMYDPGGLWVAMPRKASWWRWGLPKYVTWFSVLIRPIGHFKVTGQPPLSSPPPCQAGSGRSSCL